MKQTRTLSIAVCFLMFIRISPAKDVAPPPADDHAKQLAAARDKGLAWLAAHQGPNGSWGKTYTVAITSFACLSYLAVSDDPFAGEAGKVLTKGLQYLMSTQKDGAWPDQGHTWIHGQGFATLTLSEAAGRTLFCKTKPDIDLEKVRKVVQQAVVVIGTNQSNSGGWWYRPGAKGSHEGSTTVCAVQALVSAENYGIPIDPTVLEKGFEYLKRCQNNDGGFDYQLDDNPHTVSMKEGTAGDVATLGLMKKFDYAVMMKAYQFMLKIGPGAISEARFPYYGHFYGCMGMRLLGQEVKSCREKTEGYILAAQKDILRWQKPTGEWPTMRWVRENSNEDDGYATAFATLILAAHDGRLSIANRTPPKLPPPDKKDDKR
jgi:hypothetical protein